MTASKEAQERYWFIYAFVFPMYVIIFPHHGLGCRRVKANPLKLHNAVIGIICANSVYG